MAKNGTLGQELQTFLPQDGSNLKDNKYKVSVVARIEVDDPLQPDFDPFKARHLEHPTSDCDTLTHLLKACLGTGILGMPVAFMHSGLVTGIFATILVAIVCTHCSYVLVECAHELYYRTRVTALGFADIVEVSFSNGPKPVRKFAKFARQGVLINLFVTYYGTCSVYAVIVATNFEKVIGYYMGQEINLRLVIVCLVVPLILLSWVPDLKYLAPVSMIANGFMAVGLAITFYYLVVDIEPLDSVSWAGDGFGLPAFFSIVIFAMEAIGVVMPLENNMKNPQHFLGLCGVLNQGFSAVTLVYIMLGFFGYLKYGEFTKGSITLNLPEEDILAQSVKILIALAVFCTYGLQFYVCLEIVWNAIKDKCTKRPKLYNYMLRTVLVILSIVIAIAVPTIGPFMGLIGAFCFSILGIVVPVVLEMITFWERGFGKCYWRIWKNVFVLLFGIGALIFGTKSSIEDIAKLYTS